VSHSARKHPRQLTAQAPCRVDLAGGTVDIWPLYLFHPGAVTVNFAVSVMARCRVSRLPGRSIHLRSLDTGREESFASLAALGRARDFRHPLAARLVEFFAPQSGLLVETHSESPAGAGISGSSALMMAGAAALAHYTGKRFTREQLRQLGQNLESRIIAVPTGCQDYYPALFGGVSALALRPDGIHRESIPVVPAELNARFVLAYTGAPRQSGINNWEVFKAHLNGDRRVFRNFAEIVHIAQAMRQSLLRRDWHETARLLREEWKLRKTNAPGISTPFIEELIATAGRHGSVAAKVCGAGGGGCVVFLVEPGTGERVAKAIAARGGKVLACALETRGLTIRSGV